MFAQGSFLQGPEGLTPEQIEARRQILRDIMSGGTPRYAGEGLARLATGVVAGIGNARMNNAEQAGRDSVRDLLASIFGGGSAGGSTGGASGGGSYVSNTSSRSGPSTANTTGVANAVSGNTSAPTAGLRFMLPDEDPDAGDPRRGSFATAAPRVDDPNIYTTSVTGATGGVGQGIIDIVGNSVEQAYGPGAAVGVSSGLRPGSAGSQHSAGNALDFSVTDRAGNRSSYADPRVYDAARVAASQGASGIGIGPNYMGGETFHMDTGQGGATAPNFGNTVRTWSDWNTSGPRGASDPQGAGDPAYGLRAELQGIRDGRQVPTGTTGPARPQNATVTASARNPGATPAQGAPAASGGAPSLPQLYQALANPWLSPNERAAIASMIQVQERDADPMRQLQMEQLRLQIEQARQPQTRGRLLTPDEEIALGLDPAGSYNMRPDGTVSAVGGGGTTINNNIPGDPPPGDTEFFERLGTQQANTAMEVFEQGRSAENTLARVDELDRLLSETGSGAGQAFRAAASRFGVELGENVSELQAAEAIINQLIPAQRPPGSGEMSNMDLQMFRQSVPSLWNQPGGNELIISTMRAIAEYDRQAGQIAARMMYDPAYSRDQGFRDLYELENPLRDFEQRRNAVVSGPEGGSQVTQTDPEARTTNPPPVGDVAMPQGFPASAWSQISPENRAAAANLWNRMTPQERMEFGQ